METSYTNISDDSYNQKEKSRSMKFISKSREDLQKLSSSDFQTLCSWLRDIHNQNIRLINQFKILEHKLDDLTPVTPQERLPEEMEV